MKASGSASARQPFMLRAPMPGSMKTGTAPALNRAKVRANSSGEGGTSSATRVPRTMPMRPQPGRNAVTVPVQFPKGQGAPFLREDDGGGIRLEAGHLGQRAGDVDDVGVGHNVPET